MQRILSGEPDVGRDSCFVAGEFTAENCLAESVDDMITCRVGDATLRACLAERYAVTGRRLAIFVLGAVSSQRYWVPSRRTPILPGSLLVPRPSAPSSPHPTSPTHLSSRRVVSGVAGFW